MMIHIWMHWFWITTVYFKGFLLFTGQTISLSCISLPHLAEAGLRDNETSAPVIPDPFIGYNSSQLGNEENVTSGVVSTDGGIDPPDTTPVASIAPVAPIGPVVPHQSSPSSPQETSTEESTTPRSEDAPRAAFGPTSDVEDIYAGGNLDGFQYPLKKFTKYSHLKYGKVKTKGKPNDETGVDERKVESVKLVEEKVNINISITEDGDGGSVAEVDKTKERQAEGGTSEVPTSDAPDLITTTLNVENVTSEEGGPGNETAESVSPPKDGTNATSSPPVESSTRASEAPPPPPPPPTDAQKEVEVLKNETLVIENKVEESGAYTTVEPFVVRNRVAAATSAQNFEVGPPDLNAGSITGITLGILVVFSLFGAVSFVLYRRRYLNKPQVLHDKCSNLDSSGYIDETSLRENSEEMYSLDNDSFLNSLEAMTIQNYWTENVKHTKL